jgi:hypothetical protein
VLCDIVPHWQGSIPQETIHLHPAMLTIVDQFSIHVQ